MTVNDLRLGTATALRQGPIRPFLSLLGMVYGEIEADAIPFGQSVIAIHYERLLLALLINCLPLEAMLLPKVVSRTTVPLYLQRAEDFIRANARNSLSTVDIAVAAGVSPRSLQYGFRRFCGATPTQFVKGIRLERARAVLCSAEGERKRISEIAVDSGWLNMSQFSRDYRATFGETPTQTVAAQKMLAIRGDFAPGGYRCPRPPCPRSTATAVGSSGVGRRPGHRRR